MPIKSADKFKYEQSKGTLFLAKRPLLKNSPPGCFVNSPLVNIPQGHFLRARLRQEIFAHCGERPKGVALWTPTTFEKVDKTFKFTDFLF